METLRRNLLLRIVLPAILIGIGIALAPVLFAADGSLFGFDLFQRLSVLFTIVLAFAALRIEDRLLRRKLALGVVLGFALLAVLTLGFTTFGIIFLVLAVLTVLLEWPQQAAEACAF